MSSLEGFANTGANVPGPSVVVNELISRARVLPAEIFNTWEGLPVLRIQLSNTED